MSHKIHSHPGLSVRFGLPEGYTIVDTEHFAFALKHWDLILRAEESLNVGLNPPVTSHRDPSFDLEKETCGTTTDPNHPDLNDAKVNGKNKVYLVLSDEEKAKGFIRPVRAAYIHVGVCVCPQHLIRDLTEEEQDQHKHCDYVKYEEYPKGMSPLAGKFWTQKQLDNKGCGGETVMSRPIAETYARDPKCYGSTFCSKCGGHHPVGEFEWTADGQKVGS